MNDSREWTHILIVSDPAKDDFSSGGRGLHGKGRELADLLGAYLWVYTEERDDSAGLIAFGADRVFVKTDPPQSVSDRADVLGNLIRKNRPEILLASQCAAATALFGLLAQRFETGLVTDCLGLDLDLSERALLAVKPLYGGKLLSEWVWPSRRPQMALIRPGVFPEPFEDPGREGAVEEI